MEDMLDRARETLGYHKAYQIGRFARPGSLRYILDGDHRPVPVDLMTWARFFEDASNRRVAEAYVNGRRVSTVFIGLDHNFAGDGPPLLWETMVFGGDLHGEQRRYASHAEAMAGHAAMVERVCATEGVEVPGRPRAPRPAREGDGDA